MIEARDFVEAARRCGFGWYAGVPCSYLTPFINYVLQDPSLHYVSAANEGDAVAFIAGVALAGPLQVPDSGASGAKGSSGASSRYRRGIAMMQNSGLGNAVSPLTSLTWTFRIPQLLIITWRGQPGVADEPQHALMGPLTPSLLEAMQIPWEPFPTERDAIEPALRRAIAHMDATERPYALVMQKGTVAPYALQESIPAGAPAGPFTTSPPRRRLSGTPKRPARSEALRLVVAHTSAKNTAVLASTGYCGRELYAIEDRPSHLYMVGSMGCVTPLALGLALARPDLRVVAIDGDGAALMRLGAMATVGAYRPANLRHLLLDNGVHDSTGAQATVSAHTSFADIAAACGYASALETDEVHCLGEWLEQPDGEGPRFARLLIRPGTMPSLPRPAATPIDVKTRLMQHFGLHAGVP
jgi:phosphonopyruvate decarboxylase